MYIYICVYSFLIVYMHFFFTDKTSLRLIRRLGGQRGGRRFRTGVQGPRRLRTGVQGPRRLRTGVQEGIHCRRFSENHPKKHQNAHRNHECSLEHIQHHHRCFKRS